MLDQLLPIRDKLTSEAMQKLVGSAAKKNRDKLGTQSGQDWDKWLEELLPREWLAVRTASALHRSGVAVDRLSAAW